MSVPNDPATDLQGYAHPERLVTSAWLAEHLDDRGLVVVESDEDVLLYDTGHIPGSVKVDWHLELNDQTTRDYVDGAGFAALCSAKGIGRERCELSGAVADRRAVLAHEQLRADLGSGDDGEDHCPSALLDDAAPVLEDGHSSGSTKTSISPPQGIPTSSAMSSVMP